jgi:FMN-dependent dehydrogenase
MPSNFGDFQMGVYMDAVNGVTSRYPFDAESIERKAAEALPDWVYRYVSAAAGDGRTQRANIAAYARYGIIPRMMVSPPDRDLSITLFGQRFDTPIFMCPIGLIGLCAPDFQGDVAAARASAATGVPFTLSTFAQAPMEQVSPHAGATPIFFQLYLPNDRELAASLINRAETSGYSALLLLGQDQLRWRCPRRAHDRAWYAGPVTGALLDLLDCGLLSVAVLVLGRCRATAAVSVPGTLMTGGWASNLLDRLGTHYWTAPGSVRGVADFIHLGGHYYNVADFFIMGCTSLFLLAAGFQGGRPARRPTPAGTAPPPARGRARSRARIPALIGASLVFVVALGTANYSGVNGAPRTLTPAARPVLLFSRSCGDRARDRSVRDHPIRYCLHHRSSATPIGPIGR